ncbi:MAG: tetratricopeptide repeat protein [Gammaproteobacteria bacterium]|nr:tetratricopeptide repeat protein [Gammaproteobacteria bacterium]
MAVVMIACGACAPAVRAGDVAPDPNGLTPQSVRDLPYGDVLFYFYQGDDFDAITRLLAAKQEGELSHTGPDADLLLGGLYLSLGEHVEAGRIFDKLLATDAPPAVRDRAWYYLGKVWYRRGYLADAERALQRIDGSVDPAVSAKRTLLLAEIMMREHRFDDAIALLRDFHGSPEWTAYADFNLGVSLVRENRLDAAIPFLDRVGSIDPGSEEFRALKDKANLALGFSLLQAKRPEDAKRYLARVRLDGPYATKALLGFGWAQAMAGHYRKALVPWLALHARDLRDAAVQESYLAVPYAYGKLHADGQAAEYYNGAIASFDAEIRDIDASIRLIGDGQLIDRLLAADRKKGATWSWQLRHLPDAPESRYLYDLLASDDFQEGLKNYRELQFMSRNLSAWRASISTYDDMIATRQAAYDQRVPKADAVLAAAHVDDLLAKRDEFASRLDAIEKTHDVVALATPEEQKTWAKLERIGDFLAAHPNLTDIGDMRDKYRLMRGVLYWRLSQSFRARLWNERRALHELSADLSVTERRVVRVRRARKDIPNDTSAATARVDALAARIDALQSRIGALSARQERFLDRMAISALKDQEARIRTYQVQARFALAAIYDRTVNAPKKPAGAPR